MKLDNKGNKMAITYQKIVEPNRRNVFEFVFHFEHGDADSSEKYSIFHQNMNEQQLFAYLKKANEIFDMIQQSRSTGTPLPKDFEDQAKSDHFTIPVELDLYVKTHMSHYYAATSILQIFFYDQDGQKFQVIIND
jgi:hypothetical protein